MHRMLKKVPSGRSSSHKRTQDDKSSIDGVLFSKRVRADHPQTETSGFIKNILLPATIKENTDVCIFDADLKPLSSLGPDRKYVSLPPDYLSSFAGFNSQLPPPGVCSSKFCCSDVAYLLEKHDQGYVGLVYSILSHLCEHHDFTAALFMNDVRPPSHPPQAEKRLLCNPNVLQFRDVYPTFVQKPLDSHLQYFVRASAADPQPMSRPKNKSSPLVRKLICEDLMDAESSSDSSPVSPINRAYDDSESLRMKSPVSPINRAHDFVSAASILSSMNRPERLEFLDYGTLRAHSTDVDPTHCLYCAKILLCCVCDFDDMPPLEFVNAVPAEAINAVARKLNEDDGSFSDEELEYRANAASYDEYFEEDHDSEELDYGDEDVDYDFDDYYDYRASAMDPPRVEEVVIKGGRAAGKVVPINVRGNPTEQQRQRIAKSALRPRRPAVSTLQPIGDNETRAKTPKNSGQGFKIPLQDFEKLKLEYRRLQNELRQTASGIRANAEDENFVISGKSRYLASVLIPELGTVSVPDNVMRAHVNKTETVTYNVTAPASGTGLFIIYPNHPSDLIGYHYTYTGGIFVFDKEMRCAQNLEDNYDYARKSNGIVTVKSNTIQSGTYTIGGTMNAVRVEGTLTETIGISTPDFYNSVLSNNTNVLDKLGNVSVVDGVAVLSLIDSFEQPYMRLSDTTPSSTTVGQISQTRIDDRGQDLSYSMTATSGVAGATPLAIGAMTLLMNTLMNVDSTTGLVVNFTSQTFQSGPSLQQLQHSIICDVLDPFGNVLNTQAYNVAVANTIGSQTAITGALVFAHPGVPIGAIRCRANYRQDGGAILANFVASVNYNVVVPCGARVGVNNPVVLIPYQGLNVGASLTVSGLVGYSLVPNSNLRMNVPLTYGNPNPQDVAFCKTVFGNRKAFGIRSVWKLNDYHESRNWLLDLADTNTQVKANAFSMADVINGVKMAFRPALRFIDSNPIGRRVLGGVRGAFPELSDVLSLSASPGDRAFADDGVRANAMDHRRAQVDARVVRVQDTRTVAFPTVLTRPDGAIIGCRLYVASDRSHGRSPNHSTATEDGFVIHGMDRAAEPSFATGRNIWLSCVDPGSFAKGQVNVIDGPPVVGHSCDSAIWLVCYGKFLGLLPFAISGANNGNLALAPGAFDRKLAYLRTAGVTLAGNDPTADYIIEDLNNITPRTALQPNLLAD